MTTARKREANRRNALRSTGPRSAAGKARVAKNPVVHGLVSTQVLLPGEDRETFDAFADALRRACNPEGAREEFLVDMMVAAGWRLRRLGRMESDILSWRPREEPLGGDGIIIYDPKNPPPEMMKTFYLPDNNRGPAPPSENAEEVSAKTEKPPLSIGLAFLQGCGTGADAFSRLSRYEAGVERTFYRASHELDRLQRARCAGLVPAPVSVDIITDGQERVDHNGILPQARSGPSGGIAAANAENRPIEVTEVAETAIDAELLGDSATQRDASSR